MALIIPSNYHKIRDVEKNHISWIEPKLAERHDIRPLRIGILNIMPLGKQYEFNLLHPLGLSPLQIEPIWIKLKTHSYKTWDSQHLNNLYTTWDDANINKPLDGIIITGAPVEHLNFEEVHYWDEFVKITEESRQICASTLGLCWAGFALAYLAGVNKKVFDRKLFGVYPLKSLVPSHPLMGTQDDEFICPQSRFAGLPDLEMENAQKEGKLNLLAYGDKVGYTIFETSDQKQLMHLGHPEYTVHRIISEINRDKEKGDVPLPENFDINCSKTSWRSHRNLLFQQWLWFCYQKVSLKDN